MKRFRNLTCLFLLVGCHFPWPIGLWHTVEYRSWGIAWGLGITVLMVLAAYAIDAKEDK